MRHIPMTVAALFCVSLSSTAPRAATQLAGNPEKLGIVAVDKYEGYVLFQDPADDGKSYRVTVAVSKLSTAPPIESERIDVWLLARGGKSIPVTLKEPAGPLIEVATGYPGSTANAIFFFEHAVERSDLVAVVVAVDNEPRVFKMVPRP